MYCLLQNAAFFSEADPNIGVAVVLACHLRLNLA